MSNKVLELLDDIFVECSSIKQLVLGHTFDSYRKDKKTRFAVERFFEIIGEALNRIRRIDTKTIELIRE